ncbi:hypothetical protein N0V93_004570 [Gnomoniopsis smithogilvyi]|uniref:pectin lyase n=1 Tax=Gnomoniopsis smithogilvyi TaxID=1191159 RepID=A0A9W8YRB0_9PEZI|nr:hypothetical protein N0V93_004570 [Gnomoniopsis smithogilvyi]
MRSALRYVAAILAATASVAGQSVKGTAYGFAAGVTGGGSAEVSTPTTAEELASLLADDTERVIDLTTTFDFTGTTSTASGCSPWGTDSACQQALDLASDWCGREQPDAPSVDSLTYDTAAENPLPVGSNKSIISSNGKGVLKGKGLTLTEGATNIIIQGIEITDLNPNLVWGGDALELTGNDGVWIDHCKFSLTGRMFIVAHYAPSRVTVSNSEFDGTTTTSATCNGDHYWTMMFYGDGDQVTLDSNYIHDCSGRAPKLGDTDTICYVQAVNNYFSNMEGHAFEAYGTATALIEGNVFDSVTYPFDTSAQVDTCYTVSDASAASACSEWLGRECEVNSLSSSGDWPALGDSSVLDTLASYSENLVTPISADQVASYVQANAGPANLDSYSGSTDEGSSSGSATTAVTSSGPKATGNVGASGNAQVAMNPTTLSTSTKTRAPPTFWTWHPGHDY